MSKSRLIVPVDPEKMVLTVKRINYSRIAKVMSTHPPGVFVEDMDRRAAYWAKRRLSWLTKKNVIAEPVITTINGTQREGYSFKLED